MHSKKAPKLITQSVDVQKMAEELLKETVISVDTEFIRETTFFPMIALIQIATAKKAWLVDPTVLSNDEIDPLLKVFTDPNILKVIHASYADQECLYWAYGCLAAPVLDTSVAAALCGLGDNIGLQKLLKEELGISIPKGRSRVKWLQRPLSDELLIYAEEDVLHLVELGKSIENRLKNLGRWEWALEESRSAPVDFDVPFEDIALKIGKNGNLDPVGRSVLTGLVCWRETRARQKNLPRQWVADNDVLLSLARVRPKNIGDLKSFRGLNAKEVERSGEEILQAVRTGIANAPSGEGLQREMMPRLPEVEGHLVDFVQSYISFLAQKHSIATRYLMNVPKISHLVRNSEESLEAWVSSGILSSQAAKLVGIDLKELLQGRRALVIREGQVRIIELPKA